MSNELDPFLESNDYLICHNAASRMPDDELTEILKEVKVTPNANKAIRDVVSTRLTERLEAEKRYASLSLSEAKDESKKSLSRVQRQTLAKAILARQEEAKQKSLMRWKAIRRKKRNRLLVLVGRRLMPVGAVLIPFVTVLSAVHIDLVARQSVITEECTELFVDNRRSSLATDTLLMNLKAFRKARFSCSELHSIAKKQADADEYLTKIFLEEEQAKMGLNFPQYKQWKIKEWLNNYDLFASPMDVEVELARAGSFERLSSYLGRIDWQKEDVTKEKLEEYAVWDACRGDWSKCPNVDFVLRMLSLISQDMLKKTETAENTANRTKHLPTLMPNGLKSNLTAFFDAYYFIEENKPSFFGFYTSDFYKEQAEKSNVERQEGAVERLAIRIAICQRGGEKAGDVFSSCFDSIFPPFQERYVVEAKTISETMRKEKTIAKPPGDIAAEAEWDRTHNPEAIRNHSAVKKLQALMDAGF